MRYSPSAELGDVVLGSGSASRKNLTFGCYERDKLIYAAL
jgi:hypothetical protein